LSAMARTAGTRNTPHSWGTQGGSRDLKFSEDQEGDNVELQGPGERKDMKVEK